MRAADILLFQEAIVVPPAAGRPGCDAVGELAAVWGAAAPGNTAFVGSRAGDGRWGVGALCRGPARFTSLWLPRPRWSPWQRAALFVESGPWLVGTLHLEVWPIGAPARRAQMRTVLDFLAAHDGARGRPVVLAGDLNCERGAPHTELVRAGFRPALSGREPTFAFAGLRLRLDHIYVRGAVVEAAGVATAARGSDHWPVWAVVRTDAPAANVDTPSAHPL